MARSSSTMPADALLGGGPVPADRAPTIDRYSQWKPRNAPAYIG